MGTGITEEVNDLLARIALLQRTVSKDHGPLASARVWKARMQLRQLRDEFLPAGESSGAVRANKKPLTRFCLNGPRTQMNVPLKVPE